MANIVELLDDRQLPVNEDSLIDFDHELNCSLWLLYSDTVVVGPTREGRDVRAAEPI